MILDKYRYWEIGVGVYEEKDKNEIFVKKPTFKVFYIGEGVKNGKYN
jgi:hypothetical protein